MEDLGEFALARKLQAARRVKMTIRVDPLGKKMRYYKDFNQISKDFKEEELGGAAISIILNAVVVGYLDTQQVLDEIFK